MSSSSILFESFSSALFRGTVKRTGTDLKYEGKQDVLSLLPTGDSAIIARHAEEMMGNQRGKGRVS